MARETVTIPASWGRSAGLVVLGLVLGGGTTTLGGVTALDRDHDVLAEQLEASLSAEVGDVVRAELREHDGRADHVDREDLERVVFLLCLLAAEHQVQTPECFSSMPGTGRP